MKTPKVITSFFIVLCFSLTSYGQASKYLPKQYIPNAITYAQTNYSPNATMYAITSAYGLDTTGNAYAWLYWFYKPNSVDTGYVVTILVVFGIPIPTGLTTINLPGSLLRNLGNIFCESNLAITAAENAGGRTFRQIHPATRMNATIFKFPGSPDTSKPYWTILYTDTVNSQFQTFFVDGITCLNVTIGIHQISTEVPKNFILSQNYPNPFNPSTKIIFAVPDKQNLRLIVYNASGKFIKEIANGKFSEGIYAADFDGKDLPSGVYLYVLEADGFRETKKMVLIK